MSEKSRIKLKGKKVRDKGSISFYLSSQYNALLVFFSFVSLVIIAVPYELVFQYSLVFLILEANVTLFFLVDFIFHLVEDWKKTKKKFLVVFSWTNLFYIISLASGAIFIAALILGQNSDLGQASFIRLFRLVLLTRPVRLLFNLSRYKFFRLIREKINNQRKWFAILLIVFLIVVIFSSTVVYFNERLINDRVNTFWDAIYFTFVTMTTIGYGDITPNSDFIRGFVIFLSIFSIIIVAIPSTLAVNTFLLLQEERNKNKKQNLNRKRPRNYEIWYVLHDDLVRTGIVLKTLRNASMVVLLSHHKGEGAIELATALLGPNRYYLNEDEIKLVGKTDFLHMRIILPPHLKNEIVKWNRSLDVEEF